MPMQCLWCPYLAMPACTLAETYHVCIIVSRDTLTQGVCVCMYVCMCGRRFQQIGHEPGVVANNPACGQHQTVDVDGPTR